MKKVNKVASILFAMALATSFISGCGNQSKSESSVESSKNPLLNLQKKILKQNPPQQAIAQL